MSNANNCITSTRGGIVENRHQIHIAIVSTSPNTHYNTNQKPPTKLTYSTGNPHRPTLLRSTFKPAQALAILSTPAFTTYDFNDADLALMCASHSSEPFHLSLARSMLSKSQSQETDLACGGHASISATVNEGWIRDGVIPGRSGVYNNCSGKHAGMIAGAKTLTTGGSGSSGGYHRPDHLMQIRVREVFEELVGDSEGDVQSVQWGIDGCNLPAPAAPLDVLARVYAFFAGAADTVESAQEAGMESEFVPSRTRDASRIYHAMTTYPENVAGSGRFCTELMVASRGSLIGKLGADGCYAISVRASEHTTRLGSGHEGAMGIAVKVEDGSIPVLYAAVVEVLRRLKLLDGLALEKLSERWRPVAIENTMGVVTGKWEYGFELCGVDGMSMAR